jgi:splicing factor 3B subunit 2
MAAHRLTKNEKRRQRKKEQTDIPLLNSHRSVEKTEPSINIEIEYVSANYENDADTNKSLLEAFRSVFGKIAKPEELLSVDTTSSASAVKTVVETEGQVADEESNEPKKLSKKKKKLMNRLSVAELKQLVQRPDAVEAHDVTSSDPRLLVYLKSYRNTVPVPRHWCQIRKYLQGKRGVEKVPFQLPEFIAETGIAKIRESVLELEALKKGKQKARERVKPKMGKIDIDYQVLHDAFFKYQTKPKLTIHGDLYYEGKEFEVNEFNQ